MGGTRSKPQILRLRPCGPSLRMAKLWEEQKRREEEEIAWGRILERRTD
jgi:hypothetical protein